jgi:hypothetical protein
MADLHPLIDIFTARFDLFGDTNLHAARHQWRSMWVDGRGRALHAEYRLAMATRPNVDHFVWDCVTLVKDDAQSTGVETYYMAQIDEYKLAVVVFRLTPGGYYHYTLVKTDARHIASMCFYYASNKRAFDITSISPSEIFSISGGDLADAEVYHRYPGNQWRTVRRRSSPDHLGNDDLDEASYFKIHNENEFIAFMKTSRLNVSDHLLQCEHVPEHCYQVERVSYSIHRQCPSDDLIHNDR